MEVYLQSIVSLFLFIGRSPKARWNGVESSLARHILATAITETKRSEVEVGMSRFGEASLFFWKIFRRYLVTML